MQEVSESKVAYQTMMAFAERMAEHRISDGLLTARVIGEFSAGKTRLLTTLFGDSILQPLRPISSLERQTRLQLEICYGSTPSLSLIERNSDFVPAVSLMTLPAFPERDSLEAYDPFRHRLRLEVSEPRLILESGDGYSEEKTPKRLFLIDTPGWNSGDDALAESTPTELMAGYHNLALIYVTSAARLDSAGNAERLRAFVEILGDADFLDRPKVMLVITHCPEAEAEAMHARARERLLQMWQSAGHAPQSLELDVLCVDFATLSDAATEYFRQQFWSCLRAPLGAAKSVASSHPWAIALQNWPDDWQLADRLSQSQQILDDMRQLLERACRDEDFMPGMNRHRLLGLDAEAIRRKVQDRWKQQLKLLPGQPIPSLKSLPELPAEHPLFAWWSQYFLSNLQRVLQPAEAFFNRAEQALSGLNPEIEDLQSYLSKHLAQPWLNARAALDGSFTRLLKQIVTSDGLDTTRQLATILTLSLLQARYEDHCRTYRKQLLSEINA